MVEDWKYKIVNKIKKTLAEGFLVVEKYEDENHPDVAFRRLQCMGDGLNKPPCMFYDAKRDECTDCGCIVELKSMTITHREPELGNFKELAVGGQIIKTHCTRGRWGDKVIANFYRKIKGLKLLK